MLAAALRFGTLDAQSFSDDELFTTWLVQMPFGEMVSTIPRTEATPHLFYVLEWLAAQVFGTGEVGMRLLPALAGTLTVPVVYAAGAAGGSRPLGLAAAAFTAVNPFLVWFSQEARAYALLILLIALSLACLVAYTRDRGTGALAGWAIASAAAIATHYFTLFLIAPEVVWVLLLARGAPRRHVAAAAVPTLAGLALLPLALHQRDSVGDPGGLGGSGIAERAAGIPKNFLVGYSIPLEVLVTTVAGVLGAVVLLLALRASGDDRRLGAGAAALVACGVGIPLVLAPFGLDYVTSRNVIAALIPLALVIGCGAVAGARLGVVALGAICVLSVALTLVVAADDRYQRRDWRGADRAMGTVRDARVVIFSPPFSNLGPPRVYLGPGTSFLRPQPPRVREILVVGLISYRRLVPDAPKPPGGPAPRPPAGFRTTEDVRTSTYRVVRFAAPRPTTVTPRRLSALAFPRVHSVFLLQEPRR